ncbi:hypothetical protein BI024_gp52 [Streptomyces phage Nanodon]|uniref:Uncharacterized protein n=1 Tax=Streptomyces phage Nanodon TaxID=1873777 RepID=A0A1B1PA57_9CAUD|nr:hypothetical protein BI024_gp52 [Streptomyces phage Nanodon]ANT41056.1 hypothetical protein SEA_NANODON_52 [Streptomyces phage Nanodon]
MSEPMPRTHQIIERYPKLFDSERTKKLPVWAQGVIGDLRLLLLREAAENDHLRDEISRMLNEERIG